MQRITSGFIRKTMKKRLIKGVGSPWITSDPPQDHLCFTGEDAGKTQNLGYLWIPSVSAPGDPVKSKLLSHLSGTDWCEILLGITFIHKIEKTRPELAKSVPGNFPEYPKTPRTASQWSRLGCHKLMCQS